jgi:uncharacterized protein YlxW (UPF0749 family)
MTACVLRRGVTWLPAMSLSWHGAKLTTCLLSQLDSTYQRNFTLNKKVIRLESRVKELKAENNTLHNRIAKVVLMEVLKKESAA